jgi:hypothetical protein
VCFPLILSDGEVDPFQIVITLDGFLAWISWAIRKEQDFESSDWQEGGRRSLTGVEVTLNQSNQDQHTCGISWAKLTFVGLCLPRQY